MRGHVPRATAQRSRRKRRRRRPTRWPGCV